jgi:hypothetical protein
MGSKKIYHLEAWVVKVMRLYKVVTFFAHKVQFLMLLFSTSSTILICRNLIDLV